MIGRSLATLAAFGLVVAPAAAQDMAAADARTAAPLAQGEDLTAGPGLLGLFAVLGAIATFVILASDDDDAPASP